MSNFIFIVATIAAMLIFASSPALATPIAYRFDGLVSGDRITPPDPSDLVLIPTSEFVEDLSFSLVVEADTEGVFDGNMPGFGTTYFNNGLQSLLTIGDLGTINLGAVQVQASQGVRRVKFHSDPLRAWFIGTSHRLAEDWDPTSVYLLRDESFVSNNILFPDGIRFDVTDFSSMEYSAAQLRLTTFCAVAVATATPSNPPPRHIRSWATDRRKAAP